MTDLVVPAGATWDDLRDHLQQLLGTPDRPVEEGADEAPHAGAVVVATSGSSGTPKRVRILGPALRASGLATAEVLGGHGRWVLALPTHHVAGLQVLARSVLAGTVPVALDPGMPFTPARFAAAVSRLEGDGPAPTRGTGGTGGSGGTQLHEDAPLHLTSLVPTQLRRLVGDPEGRAALARLDAVLLGGSAADPDLIERVRATGCRVLHTYGMSETSGGCVYDGVPLPGVRVRVDPADDRVHLGGPVLAAGYVGLPELSAERFVEDAEGRWFVTDDRGRLDEGRLRVLGRVDDVIVTGGHKVEPRDVEDAVRALPDVADVLVLGLLDPEWGQVVAALVVRAPARGTDVPAVGHVDDASWCTRVREDLRARTRSSTRPVHPPAAHPPAAHPPQAHALAPHALPRLVVATDAIPLLPSGKPDRERAARLLREGERMEPLST